MTRESDEQAIRDAFAALDDAWARHDADAYGALFTDDADYVTFAGTHYKGRADIVESHRALWERFLKGTKLDGELTSLQFLTDDVAVLHSRGAVRKGDKPAKRKDKVQTTIAVRRDGRWQFAAFHNTKHARIMEAISFKFEPRTVPVALRK